MVQTLRRVRSVIVKELKHIWFDPGFLFLTILSPSVLLMLLAYVFSFDVDRANLLVIDYDRSPQSAEYVRALSGDGKISVVGYAGSYDEIPAAFRRGDADAAIVIPPGFGAALASAESANVNLVVDGSDPTVGAQILSSLQQRTAAYNAGLQPVGGGGFEVRPRVWFNPNLKSQFSMIPGLMSIVLIMPALSIALGLTREKETGTFETLVTTPILGMEYLLGKLAVYLSLGLVATLLALGVAVFWFQVPFEGNLPLYMLLSLIYLFALESFSLVIAHFVASQRTATTIVLLTFFIPGFFLTGLITPVDEGSMGSYIASLMQPGTYFITISRGVALKASDLSVLWREALTLFGMGMSALVAAVALFRKRIG